MESYEEAEKKLEMAKAMNDAGGHALQDSPKTRRIVAMFQEMPDKAINKHGEIARD